ncbi:MAG: VCBS repeat-containing protein [Ferruginibacter sp.]|nr:VCBS repeat-containing protein [Cytophagales bacterium]
MATIFLFVYLLIAWQPAPSPRFEAQTLDNKISIGYGLAIGDVDGDRKPDILLADQKQIVWYRNGDWQRFVMAAALTERDNVCIAARDIDGDGKVEVAVGAQWNPGETNDDAQSGSVHYLIRPGDPTQPWKPVRLYHEPTVHRMKWVRTTGNRYQLIVLPLHGRGNARGTNTGVNVLAYEVPKNPTSPWKHRVIDSSMHATHNLEVLEEPTGTRLLIGGKEGIKVLTFGGGKWQTDSTWVEKGNGAGEVRRGRFKKGTFFVTTVEPMHGNRLALYRTDDPTFTHVLTDSLNQGHALACADLLGLGNSQVVVGWREPNAGKKVGIRLFVPLDDSGQQWQSHTVDDNAMACEDLQVADLNADGQPDIIAAGRATKNLVVYWNRSVK